MDTLTGKSKEDLNDLTRCIDDGSPDRIRKYRIGGYKTAMSANIVYHTFPTGSIVDGTGDIDVARFSQKGEQPVDLDIMCGFLLFSKDRMKKSVEDIPGSLGHVKVDVTEITSKLTGQSKIKRDQGAKFYMCSREQKNMLQELYTQSKEPFESEEPTTQFQIGLDHLQKASVQLEFLDKTFSPLQSFLKYDIVDCIICQGWPAIAEAWTYRKRKWPPPAVVLTVCVHGFHLVPKPSRTGDLDVGWRYSFSVAEMILFDTMTDVQWEVYYNFKCLIKMNLKIVDVITTYHLKTVMFWALEQRKQSLWCSENIGKSVIGLLEELIHAVCHKELRHYFIQQLNLFEDLTNETAAEILKQLSIIHMHCFGKGLKPKISPEKRREFQLRRLILLTMHHMPEKSNMYDVNNGTQYFFGLFKRHMHRITSEILLNMQDRSSVADNYPAYKHAVEDFLSDCLAVITNLVTGAIQNFLKDMYEKESKDFAEALMNEEDETKRQTMFLRSTYAKWIENQLQILWDNIKKEVKFLRMKIFFETSVIGNSNVEEEEKQRGKKLFHNPKRDHLTQLTKGLENFEYDSNLRKAVTIESLPIELAKLLYFLNKYSQFPRPNVYKRARDNGCSFIFTDEWKTLMHNPPVYRYLLESIYKTMAKLLAVENPLKVVDLNYFHQVHEKLIPILTLPSPAEDFHAFRRELVGLLENIEYIELLRDQREKSWFILD